MKKIFGFSLVELMVTLVVVAVLTAAMAPVITKRLTSKEITVTQGGGSGLTMNCQEISPSCGLCEGGICVSCAKSCTEYEALDVGACACVACNDENLHGSACLKCDSENCTKCINGYYLNSGNCESCEDGYTCDGTISTICPKGYYCKDGITTICNAGTFNNTTGATNESSCIACNTKTANCTNCDVATGVCNACERGYEIASGVCNATTFTYTYTGSYSETTKADGSGQKILLKSDGTFTANATKRATLFLVGGGGGGGIHGGGGGGGGYTNETIFTFVVGTNYSVTIGNGGSSRTSGGTTKFGTMAAEGGKNGTDSYGTGGAGTGAGGNGATLDGYCPGGTGIMFDGLYYGGGGGGGQCGGTGGTGGGGNGGRPACSAGSSGTVNTGGGGGGGGRYSSCSPAGGSGGSGVVVILID